jgi:hypothetical protein
MIRVPMDIRGISVWRDMRANRWTIEDQQHTYTLQEWNWGLRHQLVRSAVVANHLDRELFIENVFAVLANPQPVNDRMRLAYVFLRLLNVPEQKLPISLARAELLLAQAFGWRPDELKGQSISSLDEMVSTLEEHNRQHNAYQQTSDGWTSIIFSQSDSHNVNSEVIQERSAAQLETNDAVLRARLQNILDAVASWAGLSPEPELETNEQALLQQQAQSVNSEHANQSALVTEKPPRNVLAGGLNKAPAMFFKGTARLKASSTSAQSPQHVSVADPSAYLTHLNHMDHAGKAGTREKNAAHGEPQTKPSNLPTNSTLTSTKLRDNNIANIPATDKFSGNTLNVPGTAVQTHHDWQGHTDEEQLHTVGNMVNLQATSNNTMSHNSVWQPIHVNLPSHQLAPPQEYPGKPSTLPKQYSPASTSAAFTSANEWPALNGQLIMTVAANESGSGSVPSFKTMQLQQSGNEYPFALSELEEQLADALERAAREAGIDIP